MPAALNATFGGTILFNPMNTFLYCILGSKVDNLQAGLSWLSENARVTLPTVPENILMLSDDSMAEMASPIAAAAVGTSNNEEDQGVVGRLIEHFESALVWERNFYAILLGMWLGLALIGLLVVLWHSGGRDRYYSWRRVEQNNQDAKSGGNRLWPRMKDEHPIYDNYAEKEFRGITPTGDVPQIVEPNSGKSPNHSPHRQRTSTSFFDYHNRNSNGDTLRPFAQRNGTFGTSISSLIAPGQAFLKMTGRSASQQGDDDRLVEKGQTLEKYNNDDSRSLYRSDRKADEDVRNVETPPPFWVNRFYGGLKSFFPTRGQKHGAALNRSGSQRTDQSFGASRMASALTPQGDWADVGGGSRYPALSGSRSHDSDPFIDTSREYPPHPATHPIYPRPLSRAPTLSEGTIIPRAVARSPPPPLPSKTRDRDSVDYLDSASDIDDPYDDVHEERRFPLASPASSSQEYFAAGPVMGSAQKVDMHRTAASTALAEIISRKKVDSGGGDRHYI